jgi:hypothetical protein
MVTARRYDWQLTGLNEGIGKYMLKYRRSKKYTFQAKLVKGLETIWTMLALNGWFACMLKAGKKAIERKY